MSKTRLNAPGYEQPVEVEILREADRNPGCLRARIGERVLDVVLGPDDGGWLEIRGTVLPYHAVQEGDRVSVWLSGRTFEFELERPTARRAGGTAAAAAAAGTEITASMPGTVLKVNVQPGDAFAANQPLIVMESMKMEMTLSVPFAGTVQAVTCKPGELVEMGRVLARLQPQGDNADAS